MFILTLDDASHGKLPTLTLSKIQSESSWNELLLNKQYEIEIWSFDSTARGTRHWTLSRKVGFII